MLTSPIADMRQSQRGAWVSIITYVVLSTIKLGVGWWSHSNGLVADGFNNTTDVIASVAVLLGLRIAIRPADSEHRYGHARAESVAAMIVAATMGLIGLNIVISSVQAFFDTGHTPPEPLAIWVGAGSTAVMLVVATYNRRLARKTGSQALAAVAHDNQADAYASLGTIVGVAASRAGWPWADPLVGLLIAIVILYTAWRIGLDASHTLMDGFDTQALKKIKQRVLAVDGVTSVRDLRARYLGNTVAVEVTVSVPKTMSVADAHRICDLIERTLAGFMDISHVHVHVEPA